MKRNKRNLCEFAMWVLGISAKNRYFDLEEYSNRTPFKVNTENTVQYTLYKHGFEYGTMAMYINLDNIPNGKTFDFIVDLIANTQSPSPFSCPSIYDVYDKIERIKLFSSEEKEKITKLIEYKYHVI